MPAPNEISVAQLARLIGLPHAPAIIDVRIPEDHTDDPRMLPTARPHDYRDAASWADTFKGVRVAVVCQKGLKLSHGVATLLQNAGVEAEVLEGGFAAWQAAGLPLVQQDHVPARTYRSTSLWVTRYRPKIDRIACPWLIRRFIDRQATFMFVPPGEVVAVAERFGATPFDIEGVFWSHRGALCTFDVMLDTFGIRTAPLDHLARIIRAADTATLDQEPEAAGLLAISLGLSRMYRHDLDQLEAGLGIYDALYRWCRDAADETHNWPNPGSKP